VNDEIRALGERVGGRLRARGETVAIAESSAGGLISAALLAVPGASAYFRGGGVVYTGDAKQLFLKLSRTTVAKPRAATPEHALVLARGARERLGATWGVGETGAAGPTGNRYGDAPGHTCIGVAGPIELTETVETGSADRLKNMEQFTLAALRCLETALARTPAV
jgi:nicotinamide-nucleotide amidase